MHLGGLQRLLRVRPVGAPHTSDATIAIALGPTGDAAPHAATAASLPIATPSASPPAAPTARVATAASFPAAAASVVPAAAATWSAEGDAQPQEHPLPHGGRPLPDAGDVRPSEAGFEPAITPRLDEFAAEASQD